MTKSCASIVAKYKALFNATKLFIYDLRDSTNQSLVFQSDLFHVINFAENEMDANRFQQVENVTDLIAKKNPNESNKRKLEELAEVFYANEG